MITKNILKKIRDGLKIQETSIDRIKSFEKENKKKEIDELEKKDNDKQIQCEKKIKERQTKYNRRGTIWIKSDCKTLFKLIKQNKKPQEISKELNRTSTAIRLKVLSFINYNQLTTKESIKNFFQIDESNYYFKYIIKTMDFTVSDPDLRIKNLQIYLNTRSKKIKRKSRKN